MTTELTLRSADTELMRRLESQGVEMSRRGEVYTLVVEGNPDEVLQFLVEHRVAVSSMVPKRATLEELFVRKAIRKESE